MRSADSAPASSTGRSTAQASSPYVEQILIPTVEPDDIVIIDNLGSHEAKRVRTARRAVGARLLFLPPYSLDFNAAAERSVEATWRGIGALLEAFASGVRQLLAPQEQDNAPRKSSREGFSATPRSANGVQPIP